MGKSRVKYFAILLLGMVVASVAASGYYFSHKKEITEEIIIHYTRYIRYYRLLCAGSLTVRDNKMGVFYIRQLVAEDNATQRTIMFSSANKDNYSIEYHNQTNSDDSAVIKATDVSFKDGKDIYIQYVVKLDKLKPASSYRYRIITADQKGAWHYLQTDSKQEFTALIFSDSQSADYSTWHKISAKAFYKNSDAKLYLNLGDQVDNGQHKYQWEQWLNGIEGYSANIPMATLIGNHELYDLNWNERYPVVHKNMFSFPAPVEKYKNQFYSFDYGEVHFIVLDTNHRDEMVPYQPYLASEQLAWLRRDLANTKAKWKIALMHRDILMYSYAPESGYSSNWQTYFDYSAKDFMPIFERYGVDAVLSGHMHTYRRRVKLKNYHPDDNGITYIMSGVSGDQGKEKLWQDFEWDAKRSPLRENAANYMTMKDNKDSLTFRAFLPDGSKFDEVVIKK